VVRQQKFCNPWYAKALVMFVVGCAFAGPSETVPIFAKRGGRNRRQNVAEIDAGDKLPRLRHVALGHIEVIAFLENEQSFGAGSSYSDLHLLAEARIAGTTRWTRDKRLHQAVLKLNLSAFAEH
jgi:hypothetical protein